MNKSKDYTITQYNTTNGIIYGVLWLDSGIESIAWLSIAEATKHAERISFLMKD
jgi:hypothetical protein